MKGSELIKKLDILTHYLQEEDIPQLNEDTRIITNHHSLVYCNKEKTIIVTKDNSIKEKSRIEKNQEEEIIIEL